MMILMFFMRFIIFIIFICLICLPKISWCSSNRITVEITGLKPEDTEVVLSNLSINNVGPIKLSDSRTASYYQLGIEEIQSTLESLGYYHPKIQAKLISTTKGLTAKYHIYPGKPVLIHSISIQLLGKGSSQAALQTLIKDCPLKKGEPLQHKVYETFKQRLLGRILQLGYLDAVFNVNEIRLDLAKNQADILLRIDTGTQYTLGPVQFISPPYPVEFLNRYIHFSTGSPYTTEQLLHVQKAFIDTELFTKVRVEPEFNETKNFAVPLNIRLTRKPYNKYTARIGFGTDTGTRGLLAWERRRALYPGHRINVSLKGSKRLNQANVQYVIPGKHPITDRLVFGGQVSEEKTSDKKYSLVSEPNITQLKKRDHLENILSLRYLNILVRALPSEPKAKSHFLLSRIGLAWSTIKKITLLQEGTRIIFNVQGGLKSLLSSTNFLQGEVQLKWMIPITDLSRLIIRNDVGATATSNFNVVPWTLRYFTGGDHTVRGFGYNSISPTELDPNTQEYIRVGGRYLMVGSLELERRIYKNIGAAVFVDTGNAMNTWRSRFSTGAGVGLRYETPLGPLRLDIARPMMKGKQKPRIHLTFGMDL